MGTVIIIGVLVIFVLLGIRYSMKHFRGEGGCCGGGDSVKIERKKLKKIVKQKTIVIEGMSCKHCKIRVENSLNAVEGVSARVNLKKKTAVVSMDREVSDEVLKRAVESAGYEVVEI